MKDKNIKRSVSSRLALKGGSYSLIVTAVVLAILIVVIEFAGANIEFGQTNGHEGNEYISHF